jgi:protein arginine kinase activator
VAEAGDAQVHKAPQVVCPTCGTSYEEFIKDSRFGCSDCYSVFDLLISDNIKQLQGSDTHKGKKPQKFRRIQPAAVNHPVTEPEKLEPDEKIRLLEARLQDALSREDYETAAKCRDEIREIREGSASV